MSRVICEVCGTAYPEASNQCPICGSVRPADANGVSYNDNEQDSVRTYQHVKGGRFSKANVQKRSNSVQGGSFSKNTKDSDVRTQNKPKPKKKKPNSNKGLVITILVLLLAIIAVVSYIILKFFVVPAKPEQEVTEPVITEAPTVEATEETLGEIPCQDITLDTYEIYLEKNADFAFITVTPEPFDTTDEVIFESEKSSIAMVEPDGRVVAVSKGETTITVTCGIVSAQCKVYVGKQKEVLEFDVNNILFNAAGETEVIYSGNIPVDDIIWTIDDPSVATIDGGVVTAEGIGVTTVYGEYDGIIVNCVVRCEWVEETEGGLEGNGGVTSDAETEPESESDSTEPTQASSNYAAPYAIKNLYGIDNESAMISVGETFKLALKDSNGKTIEGVTWTVEGSSCSVSNGTVKGLRSGNCTIVATFEGQTYKFTVYVK